MKFKGPEKNEILTPFIVMSSLRKIGNEEINVKKFRNFVIIEFVKSGICFRKKSLVPNPKVQLLFCILHQKDR